MDKALIVMFDARMKTFTDRKNYRVFARKLAGEGFTAVQKSVYIKSITSCAALNARILRIKKFTPSSIQVRIIVLPPSVLNSMVNINCDAPECDLPTVICI